MKRLVVIGQTGQLARELVTQGEGAGWQVMALARDVADLSDPEGAGNALEAVLPAHAVINAAAYTAVDRAESEEARTHTINAEAPGALAKVCADAGVPFLHVSTDYVFDGTKASPYTEDDATAPQGAYGRSKLAGEEAVMAAGGQWLIARTAWVYSPHGANFVKTMLRLGKTRDEMRVVDDQQGCPTAAHELARCLLVAANATVEDREAGGLYHLAGAGETSWAGFAEGIFSRAEPHWCRRPVLHRITTEEYPTPARRPANSRLDSAKFEADFGTRPEHWEMSLDTVMARLREAEPDLF